MTLEDIDHAVANILKTLPPKPPHMTTADYERKHALRRLAALEAIEKLRMPALERLENKVAELRSQVSQLTKERDEALQKLQEALEQVNAEKQRADAALTLANAREAEAAASR